MFLFASQKRSGQESVMAQCFHVSDEKTNGSRCCCWFMAEDRPVFRCPMLLFSEELRTGVSGIIHTNRHEVHFNHHPISS